MARTQDLDQTRPARTPEREHLPTLDIAPLFEGDRNKRLALEQRIREACLGSGYFHVENSRIPGTVVSRALESMDAFFRTPDEGPVKQAVHSDRSGGKRGWTPLFREPAYQAGTLAYLESFDLGQALASDRCRELGIEPNVWPDLPGFRNAVQGYYDAVTDMGRALAEVFSVILGMDPGFINRHSGERAPRTMRLLHYPANDGPADARHVGISAHTDFECFTIMHQTAGGLELTDSGGEWWQAPADVGSFTVILGDMLERLSNGFLQATGHRVANTPWTRYSMVLFFALDGDFEVAPLPRFITAERPSRYPPTTQDAHIERELQRARRNDQPAASGANRG
jgi:isopenicillin N synthase-like dioxygenase